MKTNCVDDRFLIGWTDKKIYGRKDTAFASVAGIVADSRRRCQMEGCLGVRLMVRWPDGKVTWPCSKSVIEEGDHLRIL